MNKTVIIVLIILALLFVVGMSGHLFSKKESGGGSEDAKTKTKMNEYFSDGGGWLVGINEKMSVFAKKLNTDRVSKITCSLDKKKNVYILSGNNKCEIVVDGDPESENEMEEARIEVSGKVKVVTKMEGPCHKSNTRALKGQFFKKAQIYKPGVISPAKKITTNYSQATLRISFPDDEELNGENCVINSPVKIPVLRVGGTITIKCLQCASNVEFILR